MRTIAKIPCKFEPSDDFVIVTAGPTGIFVEFESTFLGDDGNSIDPSVCLTIASATVLRDALTAAIAMVKE